MSELNRKQLKQFCELVARMEPSAQFEIQLNLSPRDVSRLKQKLDINSAEDAKKYLEDIFYTDDKVHDDLLAIERAKAKDALAVAEKKLDEINRRADKEREERRKLVRDALDPNKIKQDDIDRQKRFDKLQEEANRVETSNFRLPNSVRPEQFQHELTTYGWAFCTQKYNVSRNDIRSEVKRLGLKINFDLVRR